MNYFRFSTGLMTTAIFASLFTIYALLRSSDLGAIATLFATHLSIGLVGSVISYFGFRRLSHSLMLLDLPAGVVYFFHVVTVALIGTTILNLLIRFEVLFGYLLLPIAIELLGALSLALIIRCLTSRNSDAQKLFRLIILTAGLGALLLIS